MSFQLTLFTVCCWRWFRAYLSTEPATEEGIHIVEGSLTFLLVLCFCFLADRTHTFEKAHKLFSWVEFSIAGLLCLVLGVISIRQIKVPQVLSLTQGDDDLFLSHMQTDEWKGWMQILILIYHYTGASSVVEIYKIIRLVVSAYLFLTGYGNTLSLLQKPEFTLRKASATLLRLNILSISLSYMMGTNYLFYYFPALATFWYLVTYTTLGISHQKNDNMLFVFCKILAATVATTSFILIPGVMEAIGGALFHIFRIDWHVQEWRFRMRLDLFIAYVGMIAAILRRKSQHNLQIEKNSQHSSSIIVRQLSAHKVKLGLLLVSLLFGIYVAISRTLPGKYDYNQIHPFVSWIPILSFVALRNSCATLRSYHSSLFAWVGKISLETYLLQYHIWLAADTKGLLRIGLFNAYIEALMHTSVFIWMSWRLSEATRVVVRWLTTISSKQSHAGAVQDSSYALLLSSRDNEESHDNTAIDTSQSVEDLETSPRDRQDVTRDRFIICLSGCRNIFSNLRWRMFMIVVVLWLANLLEVV